MIAINIVNYNFPETLNYRSCFRLREDTEREIVLTDALEIYFINMVKYREQARELLAKEGLSKQSLNDPLLRWLVWLDKSSKPEMLEEVTQMDKAIKTADERLEHVTQDEDDMWALTRYMMGECDRTSEMNYAVEKGIEKHNKYVIDLIDQGLTTEEIKQRLKQKEND